MTMWLFRFYAALHIISFQCLLFYTSTELKSFSDILGFPIDKYELNMSEMCPFSYFCTKPAQKNYTYDGSLFGPCCQQCSCHKHCFARRDCCIDALISTETYNVDIVDHIVCTMADINNREHKVPKYNVVTSCTNYKGEKISCSKTIDERTRPEEIVFVSSKDGYVIFLNEDCARCHGANDTIRWKLSVVDCTNDLFKLGLSGKTMFTYALANCIVFSQPPSDLCVSESMCTRTYIPVVDKCENQDDNELTQLCDNKLVPELVQSAVKPKTTIYRNVFCYLCNVRNERTFVTDCLKLNDYTTPLSYILNLDLTVYDDPAYVDDGNGGIAGDTNKTINCDDNEFRDPFFDICRQLICPFPNRTKFNTCMKPPVIPFKPTLSLSFTIHIEQTVCAVEVSDSDTKLKLTVQDFIRISKLSQCEYVTFKQVYYFTTSNGVLEYIVVDVVFRRTEMCGKNVLQDIFSNDNLSAEDKQSFQVFNITVHNYTMKINIPVPSVDYSNYSLIPKVWLYKTESHTSKDLAAYHYENPKLYFAKVDALPCPFTYLVENEYISFISKEQVSKENLHNKVDEQRRHKKAANTIDGFISREYYTNGDTKKLYFVCIATYMGMVINSSVIKDSYPIKGIVTLTLSSISIICILICFVIYSKSATKRSLPSKLFKLALCNLLIAQVLFQFGVERTTLPFLLCVSIGIFIHFFWLSAIFSLNAFCVLVAVKLQVLNDRDEDRRSGIIKSVLYVYGLSALFVGGNITYSSIVNDTIGYGLQLCYINEALMRLLFFALPIFCTVVVNCFVYLYILYYVTSTSAMAGQKSNDVKYAALYFRLLLITGVAWLFGFLNEYFSSDILDYCFIVLIGGQGLFLFLAFNCGRIWSKSKTTSVISQDTQYISDTTASTDKK